MENTPLSAFRVKIELICDELKSALLHIKKGKLKLPIVISVYRPPGKLIIYFGRLEPQNKGSFIMGDTNCDFDTTLANGTKHLNNFLNSFGYKQIIKDLTMATSTTSTIIDHIMTNRPEVISYSGVIPCGISDHYA